MIHLSVVSMNILLTVAVQYEDVRWQPCRIAMELVAIPGWFFHDPIGNSPCVPESGTVHTAPGPGMLGLYATMAFVLKNLDIEC
jgi:hypothetical protein